MKRLCLLLSVFFTATLLSACNGGALNPPFALRQAQGDNAQGDNVTGNAASGARSHAAAIQNPAKSTYKSIYAFKGTPDGASPYSGLVAWNGSLYGTTLNGSKNYCAGSCGSNNCYLGCGTVFALNSAGQESVFYNFDGNFNGGADGSWPFAGLTRLGSALYGTTSGAGKYQHGTVYTINGPSSERVIYSFAGGSDGISPEAPLIALRGTLYGTTVIGGGSGCGGSGCGTVFKITTGGTEKVLYSFKGGSDGNRVYAPVTALGGKLYGATLEGGQGCGSTGCGTIFQLTTRGKEKVLYRFSNSGDGAYPNGLIAVNGVLYGTTEGGGKKNSGTFFSITPSGTLTTLYNFLDIPDGNLPGASLIFSKGYFYGTTVGGGDNAGDGTVFQMTPTGIETVLYRFAGGTDGSAAQGPVYLYSGWLYGTTTRGGGTGCGGQGCGTIYKVKP
jgi:uncharacterized repeat protein (TIGR03803 family)